MHLSVALVLAFSGGDPFFPYFWETLHWINVTRPGGVVEIEVWLLRIFKVNTTERDLELMSGRFMSYGGILFGGLRKCIVVRYTLNAVELRIEGVESGFSTGGRFDVGFLRDEAGYISRGSDVARIDRIGEDLERGAVSVGRGDGWRYECKRSWCNCRGYGHGTELHDDGCDGSAV